MIYFFAYSLNYLCRCAYCFYVTLYGLIRLNKSMFSLKEKKAEYLNFVLRAIRSVSSLHGGFFSLSKSELGGPQFTIEIPVKRGKQ